MTFNILLTDLEGQKGTWCHVSMEAADLIRRTFQSENNYSIL